MALIFDIKRYAIHDGPGIRTTIFVKGCPLRCVWCHNPESWSPKRQQLYKKNKCIGCSSCVEACPKHLISLTPEGMSSDADECILCGKCEENCPALAIEICGREYSIDDLMLEIEKERGIMEQGNGGVTISGGEPLMHPDFTLDFLKAVKEKGFHRTVDTTLFASEDIVRKIAEECELFLVDLKCMDDDMHKLYTGVSNQRILDNLRFIASLNHPYYIRIPLIREVNSSESNISATIDFLLSLERQPEVIDLLPYHDIGKGKHERIGSIYNPEDYSLTAPSQEEIERCIAQFKDASLNVRIGG